MKIFFVFNPKAGKERIKDKLGEIIELFSSDGNEVIAKETTKRGDATEWVRDLSEDFDRVICSGGDGTLDEVVYGMSLREKKLPIGYIPAGSTNDFAVSLGIPVSPLEAARAAISSDTYSSDLGRFNSKTFVYVAAFGLFTDVSYETPQKLKNRFGHAAYIMEGAKKITKIRTFPMHVEAEGVDISDRFIYGMITNSLSVGGFKGITGSDVVLNDGMFEVTLVKAPRKPGQLGSILRALLTRKMNSPMLCSFKASEVKFTSDNPVAWTVDGEYAGDEKEVTIKDDMKAFEMVVSK